MRILLINPNTSRAMTATIAAAAREVAGADAEIVAVCPEPGRGPAAVESHVDEVAAAAAVVELVRADLATGGSDAYVLACFGDPGLDAARELVEVPVIGIAEAAMHVAAIAGRRFAIVTTLGRTLGRARDLVARYGMDRACAQYRAVEIPVLALEKPDEHTLARIERECRAALDPPAVGASGASGDPVDAIVLGCAGMADLCAQLSARVDAPVIDGVAAAVGLAIGMARMGVRTGGRGEYAPPPVRKHPRNDASIASDVSSDAAMTPHPQPRAREAMLWQM
ncbi:aspartate/glutamate racemase family protein [Microbacterium laevaniformans]|uniref:aspartate/glutamate racemase family protein n=1 Tax=Microbacterium laevaniformans TaxID=36807 RepID=UPI001959DE62|nr:aspartate/glutamate racemase family protein [Microbacterium laevaniformans]MBM7753891.1 allantoin racemase [Microbacterium laevaniformans]GLJ63183.1 Asp/Glu racemase [Microbacterium laevaniformans]